MAGTQGRPLLRVVIYYLVLAGVALLLVRLAPGVAERLVSGSGAMGPTDFPGTAPDTTVQLQSQPRDPVSLTVILAMIVSSALMLPVVWVYIHTRMKRGYQQSLVQTMMILPLVVAGTVILVGNRLALAFSLGGIVGAVAFRNRLEDTKDAVYIFLAIAVGLACGVLAFHIAVSLSLFYNLVILALWYTDFGRVPGELSAQVTQRRVETARGIVGEDKKHSSELVQVLDQQILQSMTPDQLQALMDRAKTRRKKIEEDLYGGKPKYDGVLMVKGTAGASEEELRETVSTLLDRDTKEWMLESIASVDNHPLLRYLVRTRKSIPEPVLVETVKKAVLTSADEVKFE